MALGDTGVGKSCFLVQYVEGRFMMKYVTTVGVDFFLRKLVSFEFDKFYTLYEILWDINNNLILWYDIIIDIQIIFENLNIFSVNDGCQRPEKGLNDNWTVYFSFSDWL